jgi:hypothetical protein
VLPGLKEKSFREKAKEKGFFTRLMIGPEDRK